MKVRELMRQLACVSPDLEVAVRLVVDAEGESEQVLGGVDTAALARDEFLNPFFLVDCSGGEPPVVRVVQSELVSGVVPPQRILVTVAQAYGVDAELMGRKQLGTRTRVMSEARQICWWLLRAHTRLSYPSIGRMFERDSTTVIHGVRVVERVRARDQRFRDHVAALQAAVLG